MNSSFYFKSTEAKQLARQGIENNFAPQTDETPLPLLLCPSFFYEFYCVFIPSHTTMFHTTIHDTLLCFHTTTHYCVFLPPHTTVFSYHKHYCSFIPQNTTVLSYHQTLLCFIPPHTTLFSYHHTLLCFHNNKHYCYFIPPHTTVISYHQTLL